MNRNSYYSNCNFLLALILLCLVQETNAQPAGVSQQQYIDKYKNVAIAHMNEYGIPASIKLAQAILESGWGTSDLALKANNHFGIKCQNDWKGAKYYKDDDARNECFRKYKRVSDSFKDHSVFLSSRSRYEHLFKLEVNDYKGWAKGLQNAGYASNPKYAELLIQIIERFELYKYDTPPSSKKTEKSKNKEHVAKPVIAIEPGREILLNNRVKYIVAKEGDSVESLASELMKGAWELYRYNGLSKKDTLKSGQIVYLQSKRRRSRDYATHLVQEGETIYDISHKYAVKTKHIYRLNPEINQAQPISAGQPIKLK